MSQYNTGDVSVTNGSTTVVGSGTLWLANVSAGDGFTIVDSGVTYTVASITDDTHLELSANYAGTTDSALSYTIFRDFTAVYSFPELNKGDVETAAIWTRGVRLIEDELVAVNSLASTTSTTHNFTVDGDYTLTAGQEAFGRINLTDTTPVLTTTRNVIVSTTQRGHWFDNNTLQSLVIKTSAGTGVTIAAGGSNYCICDGTNVVEGTNIAGFGVTASVAELNTLDGITASTAELNYNDITTLGTVEASKTVTADANKDITGARTITADNFVPSTPFNFRNKIINGNFDFWDYATSQTTSGYGSDNRWINASNGSTKTTSRQTFTLGQTDVPNNPTYYKRTVVSSIAGASNGVHTNHRVENVSTLSGKTATLTFYAKADASKNIAVEFEQYFGTGGSPSATLNGTDISVTTCALTTSWQEFTIVVSIPSISTKTLGSDLNDYLAIRFWFDAGSDYNTRTNSLGQQSGTFDIAQVQLEEGIVATPFEQRPLAIEKELCQRYMVKYDPLDVYTPFGNGRWYSATNAIIQMFLPTSMRAIPTLTLEGAVSQYFINTAGTLAGAATTSISILRATTKLISLDVGYTTGGQTIGVGTTLYTNNQTTYGIYFSAEL